MIVRDIQRWDGTRILLSIQSMCIVRFSRKKCTRRIMKEKLGEISHMNMPKTSISSRIKKFRRRGLIIFPLDFQIQGKVGVGTTMLQK